MRKLVTAESALKKRSLGLLAVLLFMLVVPGLPQLKAMQPGSSGSGRNASNRSGRVFGQVPLPSRHVARARLQALYARLPLRFEPNQGQADASVKFMAQAPGYRLFLTGNGAVLSFRHASRSQTAGANSQTWVCMKWLGSEPAPHGAGLAKLASQSNYFIGNDPRLWRTGVPNYARVDFRNIYPGIDLAYYGNPHQLEYGFRVTPGADAHRLRFSLTGRSGHLPLRLDAQGDLIAEMSGVGFRFLRPVAYQEVSRRSGRIRRGVLARYVIEGRGRVRIDVGSYNRSRPLVIDPVLLYSTYLGGSGSDSATGIAVDGSGDAFVTGGATSVNFPTVNPLQKSIAGNSDAFVAELNPAGTSLIYSTYVGGSAFDKGTAIAIDSSGNAYVSGYTSSPDFPATSKAFETTYQGNGKSEAFVIKLSSGGSSLAYATYLGGTGGDFGQGIAVDAAGDAYVTGSTQSTDFPVAKPLQGTIGGGSDAFVTELSPDGSALVYSTFLGGSGSDSGQAIAVDSAGEAYVAGFTFSTNFPVQNALQAASGGGGDAFVAKLTAGGSTLVYSTYLGGSGEDRAFGITVDSSGEAYITGSTQSINFPTTPGAYQTAFGGNTDAFVAKLNAAGSQLIYATLLGGAQDDQGNGIALDASGDAYVIGSTSSANFPTLNPSQSALGEGTCSSTCSNAFVSVLNPQGSGLVYSTYLGGSGPDYGQAVAVDAAGNAYVAGSTGSSNFPVVGGAFQGVYAGTGASGNGFVAKVSPNNEPSVALNPQKIDFGKEGMNATSPPQTITLIDAGSAPLSISTITTTGDFAQTNTCGGSVQAGGGQCAISVTFTPTAASAETGTVVITDNAAGSPHQVSLSGTGITPAPTPVFSTSALTFSRQLVGTTSAPQAVTLTNTGSAALNVTKLTASGAFTQTNNCPATLAPSANCLISITFSPTGTVSSTSNSSSLTITDGLTGTQPSVTLTGIAEADFALSASGPSGTPLIGTNSVQMTVSAASLLSSFTGAVTLSCSGGGVTCTFNPTQISSGQASAATVNGLSAAAASSNPLTITFTGSNSGATQTTSVTSSVSFQDYSLAASPPLASIKAGQSATYTVTATPISGFNQPLTFSCPSGLPGAAKCAFSPSSVTSSGGAPVSTTLTITTTAHSSSAGRTAPMRGHKSPPDGPGGPGGIVHDAVLLLMLLGLGLATRLRTGKRVWLVAGILLLFTLLLASCNMNYYGFLGSNPAPTGSPSGVYTVTISGNTTKSSTVSATSRTTTVNLAIQ